jgi:hypothetical protein
MKKCIVTFVWMCMCLHSFAQQSDGEKFLLTTHNSMYGISGVEMLDPYLSPLKYTGLGMNYRTESARFFSPGNQKLSMQSQLNYSVNLLSNPAGTSVMLFAGVNYGWGVNYHFKVSKQFRILVGGLWDFDFALKEVPRNQNNPFNMDLATNLNLTGLLVYDWPLRKRTLKLKAIYQTPFLGCMYVPYAGASYYEMFELGDMSNAFHFSSVHNRQGLKQFYTIDVPCRNITWKLGLKMQSLKYKANGLTFTHNETSLVIGTSFDFIKFAGRAKHAPANFIDVNQ